MFSLVVDQRVLCYNPNMRRPGYLGDLEGYWFGAIIDAEDLLEAKAEERAATARLGRASSEARHRGAGYHVREALFNLLHPAYATTHPMFNKLRWGTKHRGV